MRLPKDKLEPIMTKGDAVVNVGSNAYGKASTGLNILRETILGRELFDFAFKEYAKRWAFKHPTPADLFRTMEDASGTDLDWFWRGWFFGTDPVDISIDSVKWFKLDATGACNITQKSFRTCTRFHKTNKIVQGNMLWMKIQLFVIFTTITVQQILLMQKDKEMRKWQQR